MHFQVWETLCPVKSQTVTAVSAWRSLTLPPQHRKRGPEDSRGLPSYYRQVASGRYIVQSDSIPGAADIGFSCQPSRSFSPLCKSTAGRKKNFKKVRIGFRASRTSSNIPKSYHRNARRRRGRARNWKLIWKTNERKLPSFGEGNRHINPGSTESPKQVAPKEDHTKTQLQNEYHPELSENWAV